MMKQNYEACVVGAKMAEIKERSLAWENLEKISNRIRAWNPEELEKGMDEGDAAETQIELGRRLVILK